MTEKEIQNEILDFLIDREIGLFWQNDAFTQSKSRKRQNKYRPNGVPDILGCVGGQFIGIEVKTKTGKMLDSQKRFRQRFVESGGIYILARSVDDVLEICKIKGYC